jgi:hypothetical protein
VKRKGGDSEIGFEPLIGKLMGSGDGDPRTREVANRIASFRRARFSSYGAPYLSLGRHSGSWILK